MTKNQELWNKEIRRIKQFIRRATKRGYLIDIAIPERPKRVTRKAIRELQFYTPQKIYEMSEYITGTGEVVSGITGRKIERREASRKAALTRAKKKLSVNKVSSLDSVKLIISNFVKTFTDTGYERGWSNYLRESKMEDRQLAIDILEESISKYGEVEVAKRIQDNTLRISELSDKIAWDSKPENINIDLNELYSILNDGVMSVNESRLLEEGI